MEQALNNWAEMYNKKDKEHFDCQLKLAKAERKLEKIKEIMKSKRLCSADEIIKIIEQKDI